MTKQIRVTTLSLLLAVLPSTTLVAEDSPAELFEQRIMPIFRSPKPSSCVQCHLASVDLKNYIMPSADATFVSLRDQGLVDLQKPSESKILTLIGMGEQDADKGARLIHQKQRDAEYAAFAAWIKACCDDERLRELPDEKDSVQAKPSKPLEVIRHGRKDRVLDSFERNVWSQRMRCFPCHTPHELDPSNPMHEKPIERHAELERKFGQRINIFRETPAAAMKALIASSRKSSNKRLPLINVDDPAKSLLVLKPTSKLPSKTAGGQFERPSSIDPVSHMGGLKMHVDDQSYKAFVAWIEDYSRVIKGTYQTASDLPNDNWYPTRHVLRLRDLPEKWTVGTRVQLFVHGHGAGSQGENVEPIAFTQGTITPRRLINGVLFRLMPEQERELASRDISAVAIAPGDYMIKVYVDRSGQLSDHPTLMLGEDDYAGSVKVHAHWGEGFKKAEVVSAKELTR